MIIDYILIGQRIRSARTKEKLSQEKLAELIGIAPGYLSRIETGKARISLEVLFKTANALRVEPGTLLCCTTFEQSKPHQLVSLLESCPPQKLKTIEAVIKVLLQEG